MELNMVDVTMSGSGDEAKPGAARWEDLDPRVQERYSGNPREALPMSDMPTIDEVRAFLHKQIAECRQHRPEDVDGLLEKLHTIDETHAFIQQTVGDRAAAAWVPTIPLT